MKKNFNKSISESKKKKKKKTNNKNGLYGKGVRRLKGQGPESSGDAAGSQSDRRLLFLPVQLLSAQVREHSFKGLRRNLRQQWPISSILTVLKSSGQSSRCDTVG